MMELMKTAGFRDVRCLKKEFYQPVFIARK